jgi:sulfonate transport system substrate-binding protein
MLAHQDLRYVPIEKTVIDSQQHLADMFAAERLIPRPLQVEQIFDDRFNRLLPNPQ